MMEWTPLIRPEYYTKALESPDLERKSRIEADVRHLDVFLGVVSAQTADAAWLKGAHNA